MERFQNEMIISKSFQVEEREKTKMGSKLIVVSSTDNCVVQKTDLLPIKFGFKKKNHEIEIGKWL